MITLKNLFKMKETTTDETYNELVDSLTTLGRVCKVKPIKEIDEVPYGYFRDTNGVVHKLDYI